MGTKQLRQFSFTEDLPEDIPFHITEKTHVKSAYSFIPLAPALGYTSTAAPPSDPSMSHTHLTVKIKGEIKGMCIWFQSVSSLGQWGEKKSTYSV